MDPKEQIPLPEESLDAIEVDTSPSVDDFIKQLEEKEKDLHITADLSIEIEDSEFDDRNIPDDIVPLDLAPKRPAAASKASAPKQEAHPPSSGSKTRIFELEQELEALKKRLVVLREERNDVQEKSDRRVKDFESFRYRMDRERRGAVIEQIANLAAKMLPAFDNLDRGLESVKGIVGDSSVEFQQFYDGIVLVNQQMAEIFQDMGVESITTVGEPFDPNFHEAVAVEENPDTPANMITEEMLRGFRIGNRVIRHSMVKVTAGGASPGPKASDAEPRNEPSTEESDKKLLEDTDIDDLFASLPQNE